MQKGVNESNLYKHASTPISSIRLCRLTCCVDYFPVVVALSTEDPHIVGYVSDTITLPCGHTVAKADLEAVVWRKDIEMIVAEYDIGDDPPVSFYGSMEGRASVKVFPSTLKFSNASLKDAGVYQCEVFPITDDPIVFRYILTVNGRGLFLSRDTRMSSVTCTFESDNMSSICVCPQDILGLVKC